MYTFSIYDPTTGIVNSVVSTSDSAQVEALTANKSFIEGNYAGYKIVNGVPVLLEPIPEPAPTNDMLAASMRRQRNLYLSEIDGISAAWYASLTITQQQELQIYRQALLDITAQAGWPTTVEWPAKPDWL